MAKKHMLLVPGTWGVRCSFHSLIGLLVALLVAGAVYLTGESGRLIGDPVGHKDDGESESGCDLFSGKWVFDNMSYPLYKEKECMFMSDQLACEKFGRKDLSYQNWRWQPHQCDLPRFNATALLERLRDKRLVFVGDSLNRNQWVSMVCLVGSSVPPGFKSMHNNGSLATFKATQIRIELLGKDAHPYMQGIPLFVRLWCESHSKDSFPLTVEYCVNMPQDILKEYNASIEFYWAPLLVDSNSDDPVNHRLPDRIVRVQAIEKHARHWTDADILVFNSYLWWRRPKMMALWGSFERSDGIYKEVEMLRIYEMALKTWADWLDVHINRNKTQLFFVSMSPVHERGEEWGNAKDQNCYNETGPITKEGYRGNGSDPKMMQIVERAIDELKTRGLKVQMINITQLSEYRKEGHPSIFRKQWEPRSEEQLSNPTSFSDCIHWCLPGVPDVWNELLYAHIFHYH